MYFKDNKQISLFEFGQAAGLCLSSENRWVKMSHLVEWDMLENKYSNLYCEDNGAPAKPIRLAIGALLIKQIEGFSDKKLVLHIQKTLICNIFVELRNSVMIFLLNLL